MFQEERNNMESITYLKNIKSTPKKLRMYLDVIKKLSPQDALDYLMYSTNKQSKLYYKALHSAIANATNTLKVSPDMLQFKLFTIEEGQKLKRYNAGSRGSAKPFLRRLSHIKIILIEKTGDIKLEPAKVEKKEVKKEVVRADKEVKETKVKKTVKKVIKKEDK